MTPQTATWTDTDRRAGTNTERQAGTDTERQAGTDTDRRTAAGRGGETPAGTRGGGRRTHTVVDSPVGGLTVVAEDGALVGLYFEGHRRRPSEDTFGERTDAGFEAVREQLAEYFAGGRRAFDLPLAPQGNDFQRKVWALLGQIPYGETRSYGDLARELGDPALAQAVGAANGLNPVSVIVPCHRVVATDGQLRGYAGGLDRKRYLLDLEEPAPEDASRLF